MTQAHGCARRAALLTIAASLALPALVSTAHATGKGFIGAVDPFATRCGSVVAVPSKDKCLSDRDLRRMSRAHLAAVRWGFRWAEVEKTKGAYHWKITDETIGALANRGIRVLPVVSGSPAWAARTFGTAPVNTHAGRTGWRKFLKAAVKRYGPGGRYWTSPALYRHEFPTGPSRPIRAWQIWNEQNIKRGAQYVKPRKYRKLVSLAHHAVVKADPKARIVLGGMPGYVRTHAWGYLKKLYKHPRFRYKFDAVALHPYAPDVHLVLVQIDRMRRLMMRKHDGHASLWITELGWGSKHPSKDKPINQGPKGQKRLLRQTFPLLKAARHRWGIGHAYWYKWRDPPPGTPGCTFCGSSGLFRSNQDPKPAWRAFKQVLRPHH
jgi:hypothetical protein